MKRVHPKIPSARRRPRFRLFAATLMLGLIVTGAVTLLFGAWVVLRETAIRMNIASVSHLSGDSTETRGMLALGWALLSQQSVVTLIVAAMAMLLLALLLRAVVLHGLRD